MMDVPGSKSEQIDAQLLGPGGAFALAEETVLGERMTVFGNRPRSLRTYVEQSITFGDAEYLVFGERRITFTEHARAVASAAKVFHERYGIGKGDRVAILAANCPEWIVAFWATVSLGAIAAAINGWWTGAEIRYALEDSEPKLLVADRKRLARLGGQDPGMPVVEIETEFEALWRHDPGASLPTTAIAEDDPATILYTIGNGGAPTPPELLRRMQQEFPSATLAIGYGLTESTALATIINGSEFAAHPTSVGRPLPTVDIEIRDPGGRVLPEGTEGEIYIRSPLVILEYWRRPEATAESIVAGWWLRMPRNATGKVLKQVLAGKGESQFVEEETLPTVVSGLRGVAPGR